MSRTQKTWVHVRPKPKRPKVPDRLKGEVAQAAEKLLTEDLRPTYVKKPPDMRHTGQWFEVYQNLSSDECLEHIRAEPSFQP
ncbi:MAG: hypothetical protein KJP23_31310 [Deltaproteobacteria bacterium]|nr:hypothetical protein [Deltaproteobacteria bacterium]